MKEIKGRKDLVVQAADKGGGHYSDEGGVVQWENEGTVFGRT